MHIVFRADASLAIGNGHVMRCASLAHALQANGAVCSFVCASDVGHLNTYLQSQGFTVWALDTALHAKRLGAETLLSDWQTDARATIDAMQDQRIDWVVVDHYGLDAQWESALLAKVPHLMVIDDLANRPHCGELLLDANPGRWVDDYLALTPSGCNTLIGPQYALMREEIRQASGLLRSERRQHEPLNLLVTLGGVDKDNITSHVLAVLNRFDSPVPLNIQVVMGPHAPWMAEVVDTSLTMRWPTHVAQNPSNFVALMCTHHIAIGAAGTSALERCCLGLPSINFVLAANQRLSAKALHASHAAGWVELHDGWEVSLAQQIQNLLAFEPWQTMQQACSHITDGAGAERVARELLNG